MIENITAYPLSWPEGWPRNKETEDSRFSNKTFAHARDFAIHNVELLKGEDLILSTNIPLKIDGFPYSNRRTPDDRGVAIYFKLKSAPIVFACDKWKKIQDNLWAIGKHIEAIRGQNRWGVGNLEQAFKGYTMLPAPKNYFKDVVVDITAHYRNLCKTMHPDKGGDTESFSELNRQYQQLR